MAKTFFFYDLETSGLNPRESRIMQFAGIRTDLDFNPIGDPFNLLIKLNDDTLPDPSAVFVTGITPQKTVEEGITEAEFTKILINEIFLSETTVVGFNNIRFDDEFIRHLFWRNFADPYEWAYKDNRSRWDVLDLVRMTRALRPEGINWPVDDKGVATNSLELISAINKLDHFKAHDALSDVEALISVTRLISQKQPQLFEYLLKMRDKNQVKKLVNLEDKKPFVYSSGRYDSEFNKTTVAFPLTSGNNGNIVVYDLRYDPTPYLNLDVKDLTKLKYVSKEEFEKNGGLKLPVKEMQYNRAPAVAPLGVLGQNDGWKKISLDENIVKKHMDMLLKSPGFAENIRTIFESPKDYVKSVDPESKLYDGFVSEVDKVRINAVYSSDENSLADFHPNFVDERLEELLLHYKARNFPKSLSEDEVIIWEKWRSERLDRQLPDYLTMLKKLSDTTDDNKQFIIQELQLWAESILPNDY